METRDSKASESAAKKGIFGGALLTAIEVTGGLISGSLGLISSALNTLMDFIASIIMFFAVREGSKPPDEIHMYGHEKIESAAAIVEIVLLFIVCSWIIYTAFSRLISGTGRIELFLVALGANFISILIDLYVYLNLKSSSKKRKSEAVEAGALHFMNDLLVAFVVIIGLMLYWFGVWYADSIAAFGIVAFIIYSSSNVVRDSFAVLMDAAPRGVVEQLRKQILSVEGIEDCHHIRARRAGSKFFVDAHVSIDGSIPLNEGHAIASRIEEKIVAAFPNSDVLIHTEPHTSKDPIAAIRTIALTIPEIKGIHRIIAKTIGDKLTVTYHLELEPRISVKSAHEIASQIEGQIKKSLKNVSTITSHLEPIIEPIDPADYISEEVNILRKKILQVQQSLPWIKSLHEIHILTRDGRFSVTLHCIIDGSTTLIQAHDIITKIEEKIKMIDDKIEQVTIHCEPEDGKLPT